jgi:hypothetical protein
MPRNVTFGTGVKIEIVLDGAVSTELRWTSSWFTKESGSETLSDGDRGETNGASDVEIIPAPSSGERTILEITVYNPNTGSVSGFIKMDDGADEFELEPFTIQSEKSYAFSGAGTGGVDAATPQLDNLSSVALNTSIVSDTDNADDIGSAAIKMRAIYQYLSTFRERAEPSAPATNDVDIFAESDGLMYSKDSAGNKKLMSAGELTWQIIAAKTTLGSDATITLSSIPATYAAIRIIAALRSDRAAANDIVGMQFNSDTGANYNWRLLATSATQSNASGDTQIDAGVIVANNTTDGLAVLDVLIANYADTSHEKNGGGLTYSNHSTVNHLSNWYWGISPIAAISTIDLFPDVGTNFKAGSWYMLLGLTES